MWPGNTRTCLSWEKAEEKIRSVREGEAKGRRRVDTTLLNKTNAIKGI